MVFAHPWIFVSTDNILELDNTTQVHKTRSLPELAPHLQALISSTGLGRRAGLSEYFRLTRSGFGAALPPFDSVIGELCMGTPIPHCPDLKVLFDSCPDMRLIHLVRHPIDCFPSFATRFELDADPVKIAGSWVTAAAAVRIFFEQHSELAARFRMVRYEDLMENTDSVLRDLCGFLELEFHDGMLTSRDQRWGKSTPPDVPEEVRRIMTSVAGAEMERYGYR